MTGRKIKAAVRMIFMYLILTAGTWMFLYSYSGFRSRLSADKVSPAVFELRQQSAELYLAGKRLSFTFAGLPPAGEFAAYILSPDELRAGALLLSRLYALLR